MWSLYFQRLAATVMFPDVVLELSVEQHIAALNKKLSMEYTQSSPVPRAHVAVVAAEVRFSEPQGNR